LVSTELGKSAFSFRAPCLWKNLSKIPLIRILGALGEIHKADLGPY
jgi:hypothetical protein